MIKLLQKHLSDPRLGLVIRDAISFIRSSQIEKEHGATGSGQSSKSVADLHAFRRQSGYYNPAAIVGLDETIDALSSREATVHLRVVEMRSGHVAVWLDDQDVPLGVMILKTGAQKGISAGADER